MGMRTFDTTLITIDDNRLQELVRLVLLVPLLNRLHDVFILLSFALDEAINSNLDAFPAFVTVHGVVTSNDGCNLAELFLLDEVKEVLCIPSGRSRGGVTAVAKKVNVDMGNLLLLGCLQECAKVMDMGVDTAIGDLCIRAQNTSEIERV